MTFDIVRDAYSARAEEYVDAVGKIEHAAQQDREFLLAWARGVSGRILDVGCGPGQWTNYLKHEGIDIEGVDPVEAFIADASNRYPSARFRVGRAEKLEMSDGNLGGILAWYSLIHAEPDSIDEPLAEFARCIAPGGRLAVGFFEGPQSEPFEHAVATAYYWSTDALTRRIERAGFTVTDAQTRTTPGSRDHGAILATRLS